jgi:hypothetical protein
MKRIFTLLIIAALFANNIFAQGIRDERSGNIPLPEPPQRPVPFQGDNRPQRPVPPQRNNMPQRPLPQRELTTVSVTGTLQLQNGYIALVSGDTAYFVPMLMNLAGFIEGLKEGREVSVEGFEYRNFIHLTKLTVDGKSYDCPVLERGPGNFFQNQPGFDRYDQFDRGHDNNRNRGPGYFAPGHYRGKGLNRGGGCW